MLKPVFLGANKWNVLTEFQEILFSFLHIASWDQECPGTLSIQPKLQTFYTNSLEKLKAFQVMQLEFEI